jgi:hypothetical protein
MNHCSHVPRVYRIAETQLPGPRLASAQTIHIRYVHADPQPGAKKPIRNNALSVPQSWQRGSVFGQRMLCYDSAGSNPAPSKRVPSFVLF